MKKFNKNILLFFAVMLFTALGAGQNYREALKKDLSVLKEGVQHDYAAAFSSFTDNIEKDLTNLLRYHSTLMDINSLKENLIGTRVIFKPDRTVVKAENDSLIMPQEKTDEKDITIAVERLRQLSETVQENGGSFLYCAAPDKQMYETAPPNIHNYAKANMEDLLLKLGDAGVPYLDLRKSIESADGNKIFYYTDHHWTICSGFAAVKGICEELNRLYGFTYNKDYADIKNYNTKKLPKQFLGSYGKKVGTYFTWRGPDDFEVITPAFETDMTEEQPIKNEVKHGSFEDTVMVQSNLKKDYYGVNTYAAYSGGDYRLQIMRNNRNPKGKTILMLRDSYACAAAPFLSLQTKELHICDLRNNAYMVGDKINIEEYLAELRPDYVIVLYNGVFGTETGKYDFSG